MKTVNSDGFLHIQGDGKGGAEIVNAEEPQVDSPKSVIHELAADLHNIAIEAAEQIDFMDRYEAVRGVFFGTVALATGEWERRLAEQSDTPANEIKEEILDLLKEASINQVQEAETAIKAGLKLEVRALEVAVAANFISKATDPHTPTTTKKWSARFW